MQAIQMDQGFTSVLSFVRGSQPENTPVTLCDTCGVDSDRIISYEVTTAAEANFRNGNLDKLGVEGSTANWWGSTCTTGLQKGQSLNVSH